jgi:4'-phosphopantetheinyl transferase
MIINHWMELPEKPKINAREVQLWFAWLDDEELVSFWEILSADERARAIRLRSLILSQRFMVSRGILRNILGRYLGQNPRHITLRYGVQGKPALVSDVQNKLSFNLSHSNGLVVFAISNGLEVGVDIEEVHPLNNLEAMVSAFLSTIEQDELNSVPPSEKLNAFFTLWTCKEAVLKAAGIGLTHQLNGVNIKPQQTKFNRDQINPILPSGCHYQLKMLKPSEGYIGALASLGYVRTVN